MDHAWQRNTNVLEEKDLEFQDEPWTWGGRRGFLETTVPSDPSTNSVSASLLLGSEVLRTIKLHLKKHLLVQKRY